jgi:hypothetical protein
MERNKTKFSNKRDGKPLDPAFRRINPSRRLDPLPLILMLILTYTSKKLTSSIKLLIRCPNKYHVTLVEQIDRRAYDVGIRRPLFVLD